MSRPVFIAAMSVAGLAFLAALVVFIGVLAGGMGRREVPGEPPSTAPAAPPAAPPPSGSWPASEWASVRLPPWLRPVNYTLDVDATVNSTHVAMHLGSSYSVDHLIYVRSHVAPGTVVKAGLLAFHVGPNLKVDLSSLVLNGQAPTRTYYNETDELLFAEFPTVLTDSALARNDTFELRLKAGAELDDVMAGFYRSSFSESGTIYDMASTDFEPTGARRAFACFDEPAMKAVFLISLVAPGSFTALSNGAPVGSVVLPNGAKKTSFAPTLVQSTYLVAYAIAPHFSSKSAVAQLSSGNVTVSVWTRASTVDQASYAADLGARIVEYYSEWFDTPFPLSKLDMIAIPNYPAGAMENWGLITYRETALLYSPTASSASQQQRVAVVVAHELAHQWFGNLVTMTWWEDLWLNEGFASYFEYKGTAFVEPTWEMDAQFSVSDRESALDLDSLDSTHPIQQPVQRPEEIGQLFDAISYEKGASVLSMLEAAVEAPGFCTLDSSCAGVGAFQCGLRRYLRIHKYGNAQTRDLWEAIAYACGKPTLVDMMTSWTTQKSFPLVSVQQEATGLVLTQHAYYSAGWQTPTTELWYIPVTVSVPQGSREIDAMLMSSRKMQLPSYLISPFVLNANARSFFRTDYTIPSLRSSVANLVADRSSFLMRADRAAFITDMFALAELNVSTVNTTDALKVLESPGFLCEESDYVVWTAALAGLWGYLDRLDESPVFAPLQEFVMSRLRHVTEIDAPSTHLGQLLRASAVSTAVSLGHDATLEKLDARFDAAISRQSWANETDILGSIYRAGVIRRGRVAFEQVFQRYLVENTPSELYRLLYALCDATDHSLLRRVLSWLLDPSIIKPQDRNTVLNRVAYNVHGRALAWDWFQTNFDTIVSTYDGGSAYQVGRLISAATSRLSSKPQLDNVINFFSTKNIAAGQRGLDQSIERIRGTIDFREKNEAAISAFLTSAVACPAR